MTGEPGLHSDGMLEFTAMQVEVSAGAKLGVHVSDVRGEVELHLDGALLERSRAPFDRELPSEPHLDLRFICRAPEGNWRCHILVSETNPDTGEIRPAYEARPFGFESGDPAWADSLTVVRR